MWPSEAWLQKVTAALLQNTCSWNPEAQVTPTITKPPPGEAICRHTGWQYDLSPSLSRLSWGIRHRSDHSCLPIWVHSYHCCALYDLLMHRIYEHNKVVVTLHYWLLGQFTTWYKITRKNHYWQQLARSLYEYLHMYKWGIWQMLLCKFSFFKNFHSITFWQCLHSFFFTLETDMDVLNVLSKMTFIETYFLPNYQAWEQN